MTPTCPSANHARVLSSLLYALQHVHLGRTRCVSSCNAWKVFHWTLLGTAYVLSATMLSRVRKRGALSAMERVTAFAISLSITVTQPPALPSFVIAVASFFPSTCISQPYVVVWTLPHHLLPIPPSTYSYKTHPAACNLHIVYPNSIQTEEPLVEYAWP